MMQFAADQPYEQALYANPATGEPTRTEHDYTFYEGGLFLQDDWKATSRLTVNVGVREDYFGTPAGERYGHMSSIIWGTGSS